MFFIMTASAVRSSSLGLNDTNSVPGSFWHRDVAGRGVEGVASLEAVVWKPLHIGRRVDVLEERREGHGVAVEIVAEVHHRASFLALWRTVT
jgi:hypothetical protein